MHIFLDPTPDAKTSYEERQRLFDMGRSSWTDYNKSLISKGGGIYSRSQKSIRLLPEVKELLCIEKNVLTPNDLIQAILRAPVDLLWNGGIGTYVKASTQSHEDVGDRTNDALRIDATDIRASVVGEGGNLGLTQKARVEFARNGGLINTDAVDNSAGVDCSDHEVNIKILLDQAVSEGDLTEKQRNNLLVEMTEEVSSLVLRNNYLQTMGLTLTDIESTRLLNDQRRLIRLLEKEKRMNRKLGTLPSDVELSTMSKNNEGLTRPEASVILAHIKLKLFDELVASNVQNDSYLFTQLPKYFPTALQVSMAERIENHPLKAEILATNIINEICNRMGSYFIDRVQQETHCSSIDAVKAFMVVKEVFNLQALWDGLESNEYLLDEALVCKELTLIRRHIEKSVLWIVRRHGKDINIQTLIDTYATDLDTLEKELPGYLGKGDQVKWELRQSDLLDAGVPKPIARSLSCLYYLYFGFSIVKISKNNQRAVAETARIYFALEERLTLHWLREQVRSLPELDLWQRKARDTLHNRLDSTLSDNCIRVLDSNTAQPQAALDEWLNTRKHKLSHWNRTLTEMQATTHLTLSMASVAVQELSSLAEM